MSVRVLVVALLLVSAVLAEEGPSSSSRGKPKGKAGQTAAQGVIKEGKADPALKPLFYGAYCGNGEPPGKAPAIDALDEQCRDHDVCYAGAKFFDCGCNSKFISKVNEFPKEKKCKNNDCKAVQERLLKLMKDAPCICRNAVADIAGFKVQVAELTVLSSQDCSAGNNAGSASSSSKGSKGSSKGSSGHSKGSSRRSLIEVAESNPSSSSKGSKGSSKRGSSGSSGATHGSSGGLSAEAKAAIEKYLTSSKFDEKAGALCLARQTFLKPKSRKAPLAFKLSGSASAAEKAFLAEYEKRVKAGFAALKACPAGTGPSSSSQKTFSSAKSHSSGKRRF